MNSPNLADLVVMLLFNGSDASCAVAFALIPQILQHLMHGFHSLAHSERAPARESSARGKPYDVNDLEGIVLMMQKESLQQRVSGENTAEKKTISEPGVGVGAKVSGSGVMARFREMHCATPGLQGLRFQILGRCRATPRL